MEVFHVLAIAFQLLLIKLEHIFPLETQSLLEYLVIPY